MFTALLLPFAVVIVIGIIRFFYLAWRRQAPRAPGDAQVQRRLRWAAVGVLVGGLIVAGLIYRSVPAGYDDDVIGYNYGQDGKAYPIHTGDSREYQLQMQMMGGKANLIGAQVAAWLHGRKLAGTVTFAAISGCLILLYVAERAGWTEHHR